jgi:hypothetical protein
MQSEIATEDAPVGCALARNVARKRATYKMASRRLV